VTVPYLDDEFREIFGESERAARDENGKTVSVPEDMTYPEWKKVFVDKEMSLDEWKAAKKGVANSAERGIIKAEGSSTIAFAKRIPNISVKSRIINEAIAAEKPVYAENLRTVYKNVKPKENFYDVVLHGTQFYAEYEDEYIIDVDTLVNIIKGRKDYQMSDIRLLSCSTGEKDKFGNCFAQQLANKLNVRVYAPKEQLNIHSNGVLTVGDEYIDEDLGFELFNPETSRGD
jgi:hypothetical protein